MLRLPAFNAHFPTTVQEAISLKSAYGQDAIFIAGGTDVVPKMKRRQFTPKHVNFIRKIKELKGIRKPSNGYISIGSGETLSSIRASEIISGNFPALADAADKIATGIIQNMGTIGGNILLDTRCTYYDQNYFWRKTINFCLKKDGDTCWVAPSSQKCMAVASCDLPPVLIALDAEIKLVSPIASRTIKIENLYNNNGQFFTTIGHDELLTEIIIPVRNKVCFYNKLRRRDAFDFPILGIAASATIASGKTKDTRFVITGCSSAPITADFPGELNKKTIVDKLYALGKPLDNTDLNMTWRKHMIKIYAEQLLEQLMTASSQHSSA